MEATRSKEGQRLRDNLADTQKNYDALKRKYTEEVDQLRANSEVDSQSIAGRMRELESAAKTAEDILEAAR